MFIAFRIELLVELTQSRYAVYNDLVMCSRQSMSLGCHTKPSHAQLVANEVKLQVLTRDAYIDSRRLETM